MATKKPVFMRLPEFRNYLLAGNDERRLQMCHTEISKTIAYFAEE